MVEDRKLNTHAGPVDGYAIFNLVEVPAFRGDADGGVNWLCVVCDELIAEQVYARQFLDVLFRCPSCGTVSASPCRAPGEPLAGRPVVCAPGQFYLKTVVFATKPTMLVGVQAFAGYMAETSAPPISFSTPTSAAELNVLYLGELAARAKGLLGTDLARLQASYQRAKSSRTPPTRSNRLIELIAYADEAARMLTTQPLGHMALDADRITELHGAIGVFERWRNHPAWPQLVRTLISETEVQHSVMLLTVASYLKDSGNGVGIVFKSAKGRIPDLQVLPNLAERLDVEIKTPLALRGPRKSELSPREAEDLITRQLKNAASARRGQLDPSQAGLLVIGGFHLTDAEVGDLIAATRRILGKQKDRKAHLAGVLISAIDYATITIGVQGFARTQIGPTLRNELIRHPGYKGGLTIEEGLPASQELSSLTTL